MREIAFITDGTAAGGANSSIKRVSEWWDYNKTEIGGSRLPGGARIGML